MVYKEIEQDNTKMHLIDRNKYKSRDGHKVSILTTHVVALVL